MKIAEVRIELITGGVLTEYMSAKNGKDFAKRINKMIRKGNLSFGPIAIDMDGVLNIDVKWHGVH